MERPAALPGEQNSAPKMGGAKWLAGGIRGVSGGNILGKERKFFSIKCDFF